MGDLCKRSPVFITTMRDLGSYWADKKSAFKKAMAVGAAVAPRMTEWKALFESSAATQEQRVQARAEILAGLPEWKENLREGALAGLEGKLLEDCLAHWQQVQASADFAARFQECDQLKLHLDPMVKAGVQGSNKLLQELLETRLAWQRADAKACFRDALASNFTTAGQVGRLAQALRSMSSQKLDADLAADFVKCRPCLWKFLADATDLDQHLLRFPVSRTCVAHRERCVRGTQWPGLVLHSGPRSLQSHISEFACDRN